MKKPERLIGFVNYNDIEFSFEFDEKSFSLMLYPPTLDIWKDYSSPIKLFESLKQDTKTHKWISRSELSGITSEGYNIIFNVQDNPSNYHGYISFEINWYMCHSTTMLADKIDGFRILGHDVNLFYPPHIVLESKIEFNEDGQGLKKISVNSTEQQIESCGKYCIGEHIDANIEVTAYASYHNQLFGENFGY